MKTKTLFRYKNHLRNLALAAAAAGSMVSSQAANVGLNWVGFTGYANGEPPGVAITDAGGAFGVALANWSNLDGSSGTATIDPSSGGELTVTWSTGGGTWVSGSTFAAFDAGENQVFRGNLYAPSNSTVGPITVTISGMDSVATGDYTLKLMAAIDGPVAGRFREAVVNGGARTFFFGAPVVGANGNSSAAVTTNLTLNGDSFSFTIAKDKAVEGGVRIRAALSGLTLNYTRVPGPVITQQPQSQTVSDSSGGSLGVSATGMEPFTYQWQFNEADLPFEVNPTLNFIGVTAGDAGQYRVKVTDSNGLFSFSSAASLIVAPAGMVLAYDPSTITSGSTDRSDYAAGIGTFFDVIPGTSIIVTDLGTVLLDSPLGTTVTVQLFNAASATVLATVTFDATDTSTPVASTPPLNLFLTTLSTPLPLGPGSYAIALYGTTPAARFVRSPIGTTINSSGAIRHVGVSYNTVAGPGVLPDTADGLFSYLAGTFNMTVSGAPVITQQPHGGTFGAGADVTLNVQAGGSQPLSYEWCKDGSPVPGAAGPTLPLDGITPLLAGNYTVKVSNSRGGPVTSDVATVTVVSAPTVDINLHAGIVVHGAVGLHYRVEYRTALDPPNAWQLLQDIPSLPTATYTVFDPTPATQPKRFYRAVLVP